MTIIGLDCATDSRRIGLAIGFFGGHRTRLKGLALGERDRPAAETIANWISGQAKTIIAVDAPLGWPCAMGEVLSRHHAGQAIDVKPNTLFRRETDCFIKERIGKLPLDVGADRIARTAHAALNILSDIARIKGKEIPLAWGRESGASIAVIEVYPAGTLASYGLPSSGYKRKEQTKRRLRIIRWLESVVDFECGVDIMQENADVLDAVLCVLAAQDFLKGEAMKPPHPQVATKEGWIWVRSPS
jgi:predicted RNase H-like nuclease